MVNKFIFSKVNSVFLISLLFLSFFSVGVYAQDSTKNADPDISEEDGGSLFSCATAFCAEGYDCVEGVGCVPDENYVAPVVFSKDIAGITPDSFWYFLDFFHTSKEAMGEMGLMAENGDYESYLEALENFDEAVSEETNSLEGVSLDGVTLESLESDEHDGAQTLEDIQVNVLEYVEYLNAIEETLEGQVDNGVITKTQAENLVEGLDEIVNEIGSVVEERTQELIDVVADNNGVSKAEVELVYDDNFQNQYGSRFDEISSIQDFLQLETKIDELEQEITQREADGDTDGVAEVRNLLELARSHGESCLNSEEGNLEVGGVNHINAGENIVDNVEDWLNGEFGDEDESYKLMPVWPPIGEVEIRDQIEDDKEDAERFSNEDYYNSFKEKYADSPEKLAYIEQEKERAGRVQELTTKLSDEGVLDKWFEELRAEGLSEEEVIAAVHEKFVDEYEVIDGHYEVPGLYVLPGDDGRPDVEWEITSIEGGPSPEVIGIGRIEIIETIDPETGEVKKEIFGWWDSDGDGKGENVDVVKEGGGFAFGVPYELPSGEIVTYSSIGYTITTEAGVTINIDYPEGYTPSSDYEYVYGDETYAFVTEEGDEVTFSPTGYEIEHVESGETLVEEAYVQEAVVFADGSSLDNEPTGYVLNNNDGKAYVYAYNPDTQSYTDTTTGMVFVPPTSASHIQRTAYDSITGTYKYSYNGVVWSTAADGTWTSESGQRVNVPTVPAPVGYETQGSWTTQSGKTWVYDSETNKWTETTTNSNYVVAPNNQYRYDEENHRYVDARGTWYDSSGQGEGDYRSPWSYDTESKQWVSSDTGDKYDPSTGNIIRPDGTIEGPENRPTGEGSEGISCYGCYYKGGEGTSGTSETRTYTYDYGGHYERRVDGSYGYIRPDGGYQGRTSATDAQGNVWTRNSDGSWTSSSGESYVPGNEDYYSGPYSGESNYNYGGEGYTGGGGYDVAGNYVGGDYGAYDSSGKYTGGTGYTYDSSTGTYSYGSYSDSSTSTGGTYTGGTYGDGSSGTYTGGDSGGTYTGGDSGSTSGGDSSGGDSGGSTSGGDSGGDSGGSTSGGDSGGSTGAGGVVAGENPQFNNWFVRFFKKMFGNS